MKNWFFLLAIGFSLAFFPFKAVAAVPAPPVMTYATSGLNVTVSWSTVPEATGYALYFAPMPYAGEETIGSIEQGAANSVTYELWPDAAFIFAIKSYNAEGTSDYSNIEYFYMDSSTVATDNLTAPAPSLAGGIVNVLAKAVPDECYVKAEEKLTETSPGVWAVSGYSHPGGIPPATPVADAGGDYMCADGALPKTNESYIWGLAKSGERLWFGTGANVNCMVNGGYFETLAPAEVTHGTEVVTNVCEYAASWLLEAGYPIPPELGDWRPPSVHYYDLQAGATVYNVHEGSLALDPVARERLAQTVGLRSAGSIGDVVFLAGPGFDRNVNVFAFRSSTAAFLGSYVLEGYSNIRKWKELGGQLYTTVGVAADTVTDGFYGRVLKWVGTPEAPFTGPDGGVPFVVVGILPGAGAELSEYGSDRMAVSTWPGGFEEGGVTAQNLSLASLRYAGVYISVPFAAGGLDPANAAGNFTEVFTFDDYDPDMARAMSYGGGALAWFDGALFWGSMHVPYTAYFAIQAAYTPYGLVTAQRTCRLIIDPQQQCTTENPLNPGDPGYDPNYTRTKCISALYALASSEDQAKYRACMTAYNDLIEASNIAISIFRGRNLEAPLAADREIDVLYGYDTMKAYRFATFFGIPQYGKGSWKDVPTGYGAPIFGGPGFGNPSNNYTWEMRVLNDRLFVGTMDYMSLLDLKDPEAGADLFSFTSSRRKAIREDGTGLGNLYNYGYRTMLPGANGKIYLGTANPFNLAPDGAGGWELLEVQVP